MVHDTYINQVHHHNSDSKNMYTYEYFKQTSSRVQLLHSSELKLNTRDKMNIYTPYMKFDIQYKGK